MSGLVIPALKDEHLGRGTHLTFIAQCPAKETIYQIYVAHRQLPKGSRWIIPLPHVRDRDDVIFPANMASFTNDLMRAACEVAQVGHTLPEGKPEGIDYSMRVVNSMNRLLSTNVEGPEDMHPVTMKSLHTRNKCHFLEITAESDVQLAPVTWAVPIYPGPNKKLMYFNPVFAQYLNTDKDDVVCRLDFPHKDPTSDTLIPAPMEMQHHTRYHDLNVVIAAPGISLAEMDIDGTKFGMFLEGRRGKAVKSVSTSRTRGKDDLKKLKVIKGLLEKHYPDFQVDVLDLIGIRVQGDYLNGDWFVDTDYLKFHPKKMQKELLKTKGKAVDPKIVAEFKAGQDAIAEREAKFNKPFHYLYPEAEVEKPKVYKVLVGAEEFNKALRYAETILLRIPYQPSESMHRDKVYIDSDRWEELCNYRMLALKLEDEKFAEPGKKEREVANSLAKGPTRATPSFLLPVSKLYIHLKKKVTEAYDPSNQDRMCQLLDTIYQPINIAVNDTTTFDKLNAEQKKQVVRLMIAISHFLNNPSEKCINDIQAIYDDEAFDKQRETIEFKWWSAVRMLLCELLEKSNRKVYIAQ